MSFIFTLIFSIVLCGCLIKIATILLNASHADAIDHIKISILTWEELERKYLVMGPSAKYLTIYENVALSRPDEMSDDKLVFLLELQMQNGALADVETTLQQLSFRTLPNDLQIRVINVKLRCLILTGQTQAALDFYTQSQGFAEAYFLSHPLPMFQNYDDTFIPIQPHEMIDYLDNAATICALVGDETEAARYREALYTYNVKAHITDERIFYAELSDLKYLFMKGKLEEAEAMYADVQNRLQNFKFFQKPWQRDRLQGELERTRLFLCENAIEFQPTQEQKQDENLQQQI